MAGKIEMHSPAHLHKGVTYTVHEFLTFIQWLTSLCLQSLHHCFVDGTKPDTTSFIFGTVTDLARSRSTCGRKRTPPATPYPPLTQLARSSPSPTWVDYISTIVGALEFFICTKRWGTDMCEEPLFLPAHIVREERAAGIFLQCCSAERNKHEGPVLHGKYATHFQAYSLPLPVVILLSLHLP
jgi:hypothetical protein